MTEEQMRALIKKFSGSELLVAYEKAILEDVFLRETETLWCKLLRKALCDRLDNCEKSGGKAGEEDA
jgi:hypothetical protein